MSASPMSFTERISSVSVAGPASYSQATPPVVAVPGLKHILRLIDVSITGGYIAKGTVGADGKVTVRVYQVSTTTGLLIEVANATNLSGETITVVASGV
ncbi:MAG: hypothetical protein QXM92_00565 [Candidatus Anstonellales archaeon]